jgi:hypothetical protein
MVPESEGSKAQANRLRDPWCGLYTHNTDFNVADIGSRGIAGVQPS